MNINCTAVDIGEFSFINQESETLKHHERVGWRTNGARIHYRAFSLVDRKLKPFSLSKRLDLLFVFSLDINPGRELTEWKQSGGREASGKKLCHLKFDYLIYASLRSVYEAGEREWDLSDFHPALEMRQKAEEKLFSRLFKFNLKLNFSEWRLGGRCTEGLGYFDRNATCRVKRQESGWQTLFSLINFIYLRCKIITWTLHFKGVPKLNAIFSAKWILIDIK